MNKGVLSAKNAIKEFFELYYKLNSISNKVECLNAMKRPLPVMAEKLQTFDGSGEWDIPQLRGEWSGEKGNSEFTHADAVMPVDDDKGYNPEGLTLKQIMKERGNGHTSIKYVNRLADFRPLARDNYEFEASQELLADKNKKYENEAKKIIAKKKGMSAEQVEAYLSEYKLTIHKWHDGAGFSLVDHNIHKSFAHTGGVALANYCLVGGRPITRQDIEETEKFLDEF